MDSSYKSPPKHLSNISLEKIMNKNIGLLTFRAINSNNNIKIYNQKKKPNKNDLYNNSLSHIAPNRKFTNSKALLNYKKQNNNSKDAPLKTSLSFNNCNIIKYNSPNYSIENTISDLLLKKMKELSLEDHTGNKKLKYSNERKVNFINVNNYFSPQINIIKVNKLNNDTKRVSCHSNRSRLSQKRNINFQKEYENINLIKLKIIQKWWKKINNIIKLQKHFKGFIYRKNLLKKLEKEEKIIYNILVFYKTIKKIINTFAIRQFKEYISKIKKIKDNDIKNNATNNKGVLRIFKDKDIKGKKLGVGRNPIKTGKTNNNNKKLNFADKNLKHLNTSKQTFKLKAFDNIIVRNELSKKINSKNKNKSKVNDEQLLNKLRRIIDNKNLLINNKSSLNNNKLKFNNIESFEKINNNKKRKKLKNIENNPKTHRKIIVKSRNIEYNSGGYLSPNYSKYLNKNISTENNQIPFSTNRSINKKNNINNYNNLRNTIMLTTKRVKDSIIYNNNSIMYKTITDKNKNIIINKKNLINKNELKTKKNKKEYIKCLKYYFSLWKEIAEKKFIIRHINKSSIFYHTVDNSFSLKKNIINKVKAKMIDNKIKRFINIILSKSIGLLIKKILNKCTLYKYFLLFNYYTEKLSIFKKLHEYLKFKSNIKNNKNDNKKKFENKNSIIISQRPQYKKKKTDKKIIADNKLSLNLSSSFIAFNKLKLLSSLKNEKTKNINNSNCRLQVLPKVKINRCIYNNLLKAGNKNKKNNKKSKSNYISLDTNLIMQINQLKMIFNLIERHKKRNKSLKFYFNKWRNSSIMTNKYSTMYAFYDNIVDRNLITKLSWITKTASPKERKNRKNSCKDRILNPSNNYNIKDNNLDMKNNLSNSNAKLNNTESFNMIYRKKFFNIGYHTSRSNMSNEYSTLLEIKKSILDKYSYYDTRLSQHTINPINQRISSSTYCDRFFKKKCKIEEREIFFDNKTKNNTQYNTRGNTSGNNKDDFAINFYYKNIPKTKSICSYGAFYSNKNAILDEKFNNKAHTKSKTKNKLNNRSYDEIKKGYYYDFFLRLLKPHKKTM